VDGTGERQRLPNVFVVKFRVFALELSTVWINGQRFKRSAYSKAEVANAWLAIHPSNVHRYSIKFFHPSFSAFRVTEKLPGNYKSGISS
jgi:hypothetical protein